MRGKQRREIERMKYVRITPAHAGKTISFDCLAFIVADHPRACGENVNNIISFTINSGSPPRMRGKPRVPLVKNFFPRITPAHAGKTFHKGIFCQFLTDHPRACGENLVRVVIDNLQNGSPPRMRGKLLNNQTTSTKTRITPAHAGKTCAPKRPLRPRPDHPRACGEN